MKRKRLYAGEWVHIQNLMNKTFVPIDSRCEWCLRGTCGVVWFSIKTRRVRCTKCFTPPWPEAA